MMTPLRTIIGERARRALRIQLCLTLESRLHACRFLRRALALSCVAVASFVSAWGQPIHVDPSTINFGPVEIGQMANQNLVISNSGPGNLFINAITTNTSVFSWQGAPLPYNIPPNGTETIQIDFAPAIAGLTNGELNIMYLADIIGLNHVVPLSGEGTGITPLVLSNLNLLDPAITEAIIAAQTVGQVLGTLFTNSNGEAIGGDVVLSPVNLFSNLAGFNIPSNVLVMAQNWILSDPIIISPQATEPTLNGTLQLQGGTLEVYVPSFHGTGTLRVNLAGDRLTFNSSGRIGIGHANASGLGSRIQIIGTSTNETAIGRVETSGGGAVVMNAQDRIGIGLANASGLESRIQINGASGNYRISLGDINASSNAIVTITNLSGSIVASNMTSTAEGGTVTVAGDSFTHTGNSVFGSNSLLHVIAPIATNSGTILSTGGVLEFDLASLFNSGQIGGEDPTFTSPHTLSISGGGMIFQNFGLFQFAASSDIELGSQTIGGDAVFVSTGGGNIVVLEGAEVLFPKGIVIFESPLINNGGQIQVHSTSQLRALQGFTQNNGQLFLDDGILDVPLGLDLLDGLLVGSGTITGNVANAGILAPGNPTVPGSTGTLNIRGNYAILPGGIIQMNIQGPVPPTAEIGVAAVSVSEPGSLIGPRIGAFVYLPSLDVIGCADRVVALRSDNAFPAGTTVVIDSDPLISYAPLPELTPNEFAFRILRVNGFSPVSGPPGTSVLFEDLWPCEGDIDFNDAVVRFNGVESPSVIAESTTSLRAVVPIGATSGPISITVSGSMITTSNTFTVQPSRPEISKVELQSDGRIRISITGSAGLEIILEATENFLQWTRISTNPIPPGGVVIIDTPVSDSRIYTNRFYRGLFDTQGFPQ